LSEIAAARSSPVSNPAVGGLFGSIMGGNDDIAAETSANPHSSNSSFFGSSQQPTTDQPDLIIRRLLESLKQEVVEEVPRQQGMNQEIKTGSPQDTSRYRHHALEHGREPMDHQGGVIE